MQETRAEMVVKEGGMMITIPRRHDRTRLSGTIAHFPETCYLLLLVFIGIHFVFDGQ